MQYVIHGYQPERLFHHFEEISAIPRSSGQEKKVSDFLVKFAEDLGLWVRQDALWNVVIKKPGSAGMENLPAVMLQGHLDMVCEKNAETQHDFDTEGIHLRMEDGILRATGTTLGADNGVAVAMMMTILEDHSLVHPPLECVFTVQEETGLTGATGMDAKDLTARRLINLDSEEEGVATVSCAGGMRIHFKANALPQPCETKALTIQIGGLKGGHSGSDIHLERGNANLLMGRLISTVAETQELQIVSLDGGSKDNAIPRECDAVLSIMDGDLSKAAAAVEKEASEICSELSAMEPDVWVKTKIGEATTQFDPETTQKVLDLLTLAPNGVLHRNVKAGGFVVSSSNLGVVRTGKDGIELVFSPRSSVASLQDETVRKLKTLARKLGFSMEITSCYPGWSYAEHSKIRDIFCRCYFELTGKELKCEAIHAGLECGLFSEKLPGLDAIAIGPEMSGCHTPDEQLDLSSTERTYQLVLHVLKELTK